MGHHMTEVVLRNRLAGEGIQSVQGLIGRSFEGVTLHAQHIPDLQGYVDNVWRDALEGGRVYIEQTVDYSYHLDVPRGEAFGTGDALVFFPRERLLKVKDLKFGKWPVYAENNSQMMLYALGAIRKYDFLYPVDFVECTIYQPRTSGRPDQVWGSTRKALDIFADYARTRAAVVRECVELFNAGKEIPIRYHKPSDDNCMFCRATACPARKGVR